MRAETGSESDLQRKTKRAERKFDGTRVLSRKKGSSVVLQNKNGIIYTIRLPESVKAFLKVRGNFTVDCEATYIPENGEEEFTPCQRRCATHFPDPLFRRQIPITMQVFGILSLNGEDLTKKPYWKRKEILEKLLDGCPETLQYVPYVDDCEKAWEEVKRREREGIMLKEYESPYEQCFPKRSWLWTKLKNWRYEICHVVGYTPGKKSRAHFFGSLILQMIKETIEDAPVQG